MTFNDLYPHLGKVITVTVGGENVLTGELHSVGIEPNNDPFFVLRAADGKDYKMAPCGDCP